MEHARARNGNDHNPVLGDHFKIKQSSCPSEGRTGYFPALGKMGFGQIKFHCV